MLELRDPGPLQIELTPHGLVVHNRRIIDLTEDVYRAQGLWKELQPRAIARTLAPDEALQLDAAGRAMLSGLTELKRVASFLASAASSEALGRMLERDHTAARLSADDKGLVLLSLSENGDFDAVVRAACAELEQAWRAAGFTDDGYYALWQQWYARVTLEANMLIDDEVRTQLRLAYGEDITRGVFATHEFVVPV